MEIRSLADTDFDTLYEAFSQAFADYEVQINGTQLRRMLKRRGVRRPAVVRGVRRRPNRRLHAERHRELRRPPDGLRHGNRDPRSLPGAGSRHPDFRTFHPVSEGGRYRPIPAGGPPAQHQSRFGLPETRVRCHPGVQLFLAGAGGGRCPCKGVPKPLSGPADRYPGL